MERNPHVWIIEMFTEGRWKAVASECELTRKDAAKLMRELQPQTYADLRIAKYERVQP